MSLLSKTINSYKDIIQDYDENDHSTIINTMVADLYDGGWYEEDIKFILYNIQKLDISDSANKECLNQLEKIY